MDTILLYNLNYAVPKQITDIVRIKSYKATHMRKEDCEKSSSK